MSGDPEGRDPHEVRCDACGHVWVGFYLPQPIDVWVRIAKKLTCPKCGADAARIFIRTCKGEGE